MFRQIIEAKPNDIIYNLGNITGTGTVYYTVYLRGNFLGNGVGDMTAGYSHSWAHLTKKVTSVAR